MQAFTGVPSIFDLNPFKESSVQQHQLGSRVDSADGRVFRYAQLGEIVSVGELTVSPAIDTLTVNMAVTAAAAIGATSVTFTHAATTSSANEYTEGFMIVSAATGIGQTLKVSAHLAWTSGQTGAVVKLEDSLLVALDTTSTIDVERNPFKNVVTTANSVTVPTGGALMTYTSGYYGWLQTRGVFGARADTTVAAGYGLMMDPSTAGDVELVATATQQYIIGNAIQATASGKYHAVYLRID
jgi:hypothetical protein